MSHLPSRGKVLTGNSSTSALNDGSSFTGTWTDVSAYDSITSAVTADQSGVLKIQFSPDGSNADSTLSFNYDPANAVNKPHRLTILRQYARVVFTNDSGSNQTYMRLQTLVGTKQLLSSPINGTIVESEDAVTTRTFPSDRGLSLGLIQGSSLIDKFGFNADIDAAEDIWAAGGDYTPPTQARVHALASSDAADTGTVLSSGTATGGSTTTLVDTGADFVTDTVSVGDVILNDTTGYWGVVTAVTDLNTLTVLYFQKGKDNTGGSFTSGDTYRVVESGSTGAAIVEIGQGLDSSYAAISTPEFIVLNGTSGVNTSNSYTRIERVRVIHAGSGRTNAGNITATAATDSTVTAYIPIGYGITQQAIYTIPKGYTGLLREVRFTAKRTNTSAAFADVALVSIPQSHQAGRVLQVQEVWGIGVSAGNSIDKKYSAPRPFCELTMLKLRCLAVTSANFDIAGTFELELVKND